MSDGEAHFCYAMLSNQSEKSVEHLQLAIASAPFSHRARTVLLDLLVLLGRLDEAKFQVRICQQLFPEDPHFPLLEGLISAAEGNDEPSSHFPTDLALDEKDLRAWKHVYATLDHILAQLSDARTLSPEVGSALFRLVTEQQDAFGTLRRFGLQIPLSLARRYSELLRLLDSAEKHDGHPAKLALEELTRVHPEGSLLVLLGELQIADGDMEGALESFEAALRRPSLMRNHELAANLGVVVVAANLAMVKKVEQKTNLAKAIESIRAFEQQENIPEKYCRFFTQLCVAVNEAELGGRWLGRWIALVPDDDSQVARMGIELELSSERLLNSLGLIRSVLERDPNNVHALEAKQRVLADIKRVLGDDIDLLK